MNQKELKPGLVALYAFIAKKWIQPTLQLPGSTHGQAIWPLT